MKAMRFENYDEAIHYLSDIFDLAGHWEATISWSNRTEFEERPYRLILLNPTDGVIKALKEKSNE